MKKTEYDDVKVNLIKKSLDKNQSEVYVPVERRKGKDGILAIVNISCFVVWTVIVLVLAVISKSRKINNLKVEGNLTDIWDIGGLSIALMITAACIAVCTICIILNFTRNKRRTDRIRKSLILGEIVSFLIGFFLILKLF